MRVKARGGVTSGALCRDAVICLVEFWLHAGNRVGVDFVPLLEFDQIVCGPLQTKLQTVYDLTEIDSYNCVKSMTETPCHLIRVFQCQQINRRCSF